MKKALLVFLFLLIVGLVIFLLGPKTKFEKVSPSIVEFNIELNKLDQYIADKEALVQNLKPGNQAEIIWADSSKSITEYSFVFLHGFSASREEGNPFHMELAKYYGYNLFLPRLYDHGINSKEVFQNITPANYLESAKEAISIAKLLGKKVIVLANSTGCTLGAYLANDPDIAALCLFSPNVDIASPISELFTCPWGLQLLRTSFDGNYRKVGYSDKAKAYNTDEYRLEGLVSLKALIEQTMTTSTFEKIKQPLLMACYYDNEDQKDNIVSISAMEKMFSEVSTPDETKRFIKYPDAQGHVFISHLYSEKYKDVIEDTKLFLEKNLGINPSNTHVTGLQL